jgi:uncharacterized protein YxeA
MIISNTILLLCLSAILMIYVVYLLIKINRMNKQNSILKQEYNALETKFNSVELEDIKYKINPHLFKTS